MPFHQFHETWMLDGKFPFQLSKAKSPHLQLSSLALISPVKVESLSNDHFFFFLKKSVFSKTVRKVTLQSPDLSSLLDLCHLPFGLVWLIWFGLVWFGLVWFGLVWFGLIWLDLTWFDLIWLDLKWFDFKWIYRFRIEKNAPQGFLKLLLADQLSLS